MNAFSIFAITAMLSFSYVEQEQNRSNDQCDFSKYDSFVRISDPSPPLKAVKPEYPPLAKEAKIEGTVQVEILIDRRKGKVVIACASTGHPLLREAAIRAAYKWKFKQWKFRRNCKNCSVQQFKYLVSVIFFNFTL